MTENEVFGNINIFLTRVDVGWMWGGCGVDVGWGGCRINDAASKVQDQYDDILQALLMEGHDESKAKEEAFEKTLPVFQKELGDVYMDNLAWMKALKKDPIHKKIMATQDDYVNNNMFDPDEAIAAAVKKRKFLLKWLLEGQGRFPEQ